MWLLWIQGHSDSSNQSSSSDSRSTCRLIKTVICVEVRRIRCHQCGSFARERIDFCPDTHVSYTKWLTKYVLALRAHMSISAVADFTGLHWDTVKDIEKRYLAKKYAKISLRGVRKLGIDEVYLGKKLSYITVVRDLEKGAVIFVGIDSLRRVYAAF